MRAVFPSHNNFFAPSQENVDVINFQFMIYYKGGLTFTWELGSLKSGCVQAYILRINKTIFSSSEEGPLLQGVINPAAKKMLWLGKTAHMPDSTFQKVYFKYPLWQQNSHSHALWFPRQSIGMKFPRHCVGISFPRH